MSPLPGGGYTLSDIEKHVSSGSGEACCRNGSCYLVGVVLDDEEDGRVDAVHAAVQRVEAESVFLGAVEQAPRTALGTRRQVKAQLPTHTHTYTHTHTHTWSLGVITRV